MQETQQNFLFEIECTILYKHANCSQLCQSPVTPVCKDDTINYRHTTDNPITAGGRGGGSDIHSDTPAKLWSEAR